MKVIRLVLALILAIMITIPAMSAQPVSADTPEGSVNVPESGWVGMYYYDSGGNDALKIINESVTPTISKVFTGINYNAYWLNLELGRTLTRDIDGNLYCAYTYANYSYEESTRVDCSVDDGANWVNIFDTALISEGVYEDGYQLITDSEGSVYLFYGLYSNSTSSTSIFFKKYENNTWSESVPIDSGNSLIDNLYEGFDVVVDEDDNIYIAYVVLEEPAPVQYNYIRTAKYNHDTETFSYYDLVEDIDTKYALTLAVDNDNLVHLIYYGEYTGINDGEDWIVHFSFNESTEEWDFVDSPYSFAEVNGVEEYGYTGLQAVIDSQNNIHIAMPVWSWCDNNLNEGPSILYLKKTGETWTTEYIQRWLADGNDGLFASITLDKADNVYVLASYICDVQPTGSYIGYYENTGSSWSTMNEIAIGYKVYAVSTMWAMYPKYPLIPAVVTTETPSNGTGLTAQLNGSIILNDWDNAICSFEFGETTSYGEDITGDTLTEDGSFNGTVTGLVIGNKYHYRALAEYDNVTVYGADVEFINSKAVLPPYVGGGSNNQGDILTIDPLMPPQMYTELDTTKVPIGGAVDLLLADGGLTSNTRALWWFPLIFMGISIFSLIIYGLTAKKADGSLLLQCIVIEALLVFFGLLGVTGVSSLIPLWPAFLFPLAAIAFMMAKKQYSW